jgi:hypothetical protein
MSQKLLDLVKEWRSYGVFGVRELQCLVMGEFKQIGMDIKLKFFCRCIFAFEIQRRFIKP